jgi:hypothetical protein
MVQETLVFAQPPVMMAASARVADMKNKDNIHAQLSAEVSNQRRSIGFSYCCDGSSSLASRVSPLDDPVPSISAHAPSGTESQ